MAPIIRALLLLLAVGSSLSLPQGQHPSDYDYIYEDLAGTPDFQQPVPQAPVVESSRPKSRQQSAPQPAAALQPAGQPPAPPRGQASRRPIDDAAAAETTTYVPILKDSRSIDPATGGFIYDYMGADGSGKYEIRYPNGTVVGNFTYINDVGEVETRWYSAGRRGTEIEGSSVFSPAPPTLVDETTGANYVDLSNYDLYRHLEVPYVHIDGPRDPDERGQLSSPNAQRPAKALSPQDFRDHQQQPRQQQQQQQRQQQQQQQPQPSQVPIDFGDDTTLAHQEQLDAQNEQLRESQRPSRVSKTRVRVVDPATSGQARHNVQFDPRAVDSSSPNKVLDSLIRQFQ